jgi:galactose-1-phosphate uridylyltransferase
MTIEVQYYCPTCKVLFYVLHNSEKHNDNCWFCGDEVTQTGHTSSVEGDFVVVYQDGVEVSRRPKNS